MLSQFKSIMTPTFSHPTFQVGRKLEQVELMKYVPGPGSYTPKVAIGDKTTTSVYKQPNQRTFYHHDRFSQMTKRDNPGPGYYEAISDFGIYGGGMKTV